MKLIGSILNPNSTNFIQDTKASNQMESIRFKKKNTKHSLHADLDRYLLNHEVT